MRNIAAITFCWVVLMSIAAGAMLARAPLISDDQLAVVSLGAADDVSDDQSLVGALDDSEDDEDGDDALLREHETPPLITTASRLPSFHRATSRLRTSSDRLDRPPRS